MPALPTVVGDLESPLSIPAPVPHPLTPLCALAWHSRGPACQLTGPDQDKLLTPPSPQPGAQWAQGRCHRKSD